MPDMTEKHDWVTLSQLGHEDIVFPNLAKALAYLQKTSPGYTIGPISESKEGRASMCSNGPYMDVRYWVVPVYHNGNPYSNNEGKIVIYSCI